MQLIHNLLVSVAAPTRQESIFYVKLNLPFFILGIELCLPAWRFSMTMVASFLMVGGQLLMPGVAALCRNWPDRDDWQVLQIVIISPFVLMLPYVWWVPPSEEIHSREGGGQILLLLSQATACTVHTASASNHKQYSLSSIVVLLLPFLSVSSSRSYKSVLILLCLLSLCPSSLFSHTSGFSQSRCAGCWPPSTTGGPKPWCCASPGRTRLTWPPSRVEFLQVRNIQQEEWSEIMDVL